MIALEVDCFEEDDGLSLRNRVGKNSTCLDEDFLTEPAFSFSEQHVPTWANPLE